MLTTIKFSTIQGNIELVVILRPESSKKIYGAKVVLRPAQPRSTNSKIPFLKIKLSNSEHRIKIKIDQ